MAASKAEQSRSGHATDATAHSRLGVQLGVADGVGVQMQLQLQQRRQRDRIELFTELQQQASKIRAHTQIHTHRQTHTERQTYSGHAGQ